NSCVSPDAGGPTRKPSSSPKTRPAWTTTRYANTRPGTGTSPCPCLPPHSLPSPPTASAHAPKKGRHHQPGTINSLVLQRNKATMGHPDPPPPPRYHTDHWSLWRLRHQTRARQSHYQRQRTKHHTLPL